MQHFADDTFRDNAVGNWFATIVGLAVGVPLGLAIDRYQKQTESRIAQRRAAADAKIRLQQSLLNVGDELSINREQLERLRQVLPSSQTSRRDVWDIALKIADAFSFSTFDAVRTSQEYPAILVEAAPIAHFYLAFNKLAHDVRIASEMHNLYFSYGGGQPAADKQWRTVIEEIDIVLNALSDAEAARNRLVRAA